MLNKIPFAIQTSTGAVVSIDNVERGLRCDCHCPSCNGRLVARKGQKNDHHFAHHDGSSEQCQYAFETSVRLMLLAKLDALPLINTPAHSVLFEGKPKQVAAAHPGIHVRHVQQESTHCSPAGLFQLVERPDYYLALHFPAVNEPGDPPAWLEHFIEQHPKLGILTVQYSSFRPHLYGGTRPNGMDTVNWLLTILSMTNDCLGWIYHPGEQPSLQKWQAESDKLKQEQAERQRLEMERVERDRQQRAALEHQRRTELALLAERRARERAQALAPASNELGAGRSPSVSQHSTQQPVAKACKHCQLASPSLDPGGYCSRQSCIQSRQQSFGSSLARRRYQYAQARHSPLTPELEPRRSTAQQSLNMATDHQQSQPVQLYSGSQCPHCGGDRGNGMRAWWCEHCESDGE